MSRKIDGQRDPLAHDAEQHEDVGDHHGREQLEEVLDPEVDDPEAPEVGDREVVAGAGEQADGVEGRDRAARRGRTARACCPGARRASRPRRPRQSMTTQTKRPTDEQDLPEPAEVEVLEALQAEPVRRRRSSKPWTPRYAPIRLPKTTTASAPSSAKASLPWPRRLAPGDHRREEDAGGEERGRDQEDRELDVPGAHQVVGEDLRQVDAEEARRARRGSAARPRRPGSGAGTAPPSRRRTRRSRAGPASARRRRARGSESVACSRPCQPRSRPSGRRRANRRPIPPSSAISDSTDQTITFARRLVADQRLGRPVVRVRVVVAGPVAPPPPRPSRRRTRSAAGAASGR